DDAVAAHSHRAVGILSRAARRRAAAVVRAARHDRGVRAGGRAVRRIAREPVDGAAVVVVAVGRALRTARRRIARLTGLDDAVAAPGRAVGGVVVVATGRTAAIAARAGRDRHVRACRGAGGRAAGGAVLRAGVAVVARGRAARNRVARLGRLDDAVA